MPSKIRCEVDFYETEKSRRISIIGKIGISQLFDRKNSWITIESKIKQDKQWRLVESLIYKPHIEKITFLSPTCYISVNKEDLRIHKSILSGPIKD